MTTEWHDEDPTETHEWRAALRSLIRYEGKERALFILQQVLREAEKHGVTTSGTALTTLYTNTIPPQQQPEYPGDLMLEAAIEAVIRWNAIMMVLKAQQDVGGVGGHLASFASISTLYEVGLNHFFKGATDASPGDLIFFQGHSSEGNYARAFIEGRLTEEHLTRFRQEVNGGGLSSYPHPWLMPDFWQFATVSLGLGMLQGVYQARFLKYMDNRGLAPVGDRKVWVFCGDGEMDEPESIAGLSLAAREKLDNLVFVVNCNLQRLDGLVRSNYKIVQELEGIFHGAGWNVIKVLWNSHWDRLFANDKTGALARRLTEIVDGDLQTAHVKGPVYFRETIFNTEELAALVQDWSDEDISFLGRGAHDPIKVYAAYALAAKHQGQPTVILSQGIKGYGLGVNHAEGRNIAHNALEMTAEELKGFRDRFKLDISDEQLSTYQFYKPNADDPALKYMHERRQALGGFLPARIVTSEAIDVPPLSAFDSILQGSADRTMSTTMVLGRILNVALKDKSIGKRIVPIFSDEVRTFGLEALFRQNGIYSPVGQLYTPEDKEQFLYYHESTDGQVLEEGITEAGCMASWIAAATSYATHRIPMMPIFTYYSMFGFQRVGDLIWAAADMRARGFLIGATAGRTTLEGEGLQHQDGTSLLSAANVPSCRAYDPAFGYEMTVIMQHGLQEMMHDQKDVFYYIMAMNERYIQPAMPEGVEEGIIKGMYLYQKAQASDMRVHLLGSGAILIEVIAAADLLKQDFKINADVFSVTSFVEVQRDAAAIQREMMFHPEKKPTKTYLEKCLKGFDGPIVAATDYVRAYPELIRPYLNHIYVTLGTDGYGRSDTRQQLRAFFEVDRYHIVVAALYALMKAGKVTAKQVAAAIKKYQIDPEKPNPITV